MDLLTIAFTLAIVFVIFSPLLFQNRVRYENGVTTRGWVYLFSSKWFGATFIFLLLFGNYSEFTFLFVVNKLTTTLVFSFFVSFLANFKTIFIGKSRSRENLGG